MDGAECVRIRDDSRGARRILNVDGHTFYALQSL